MFWETPIHPSLSHTQSIYPIEIEMMFVVTTYFYSSFLLFSSVISFLYTVHGQKPYHETPISTEGGLKIYSSAFVSSVSPSIASKYHSPAPFDIHQLRKLGIASQYSVLETKLSSSTHRPPTILFSSTKSSSSSSSSSTNSPNKNGKIQVKLLKDIPGVGQAGDFIQTASTYFENKLRPTKSAIRVSTEEMNFELNQRKQVEMEKYNHALQMKEKIQSMDGLEIKMKAGPDGHLFGGVGYKQIVEELKKKFPSGALEGKNIKITSIVASSEKKQKEAEDGKVGKKKDTSSSSTTTSQGHDIKQIGQYKVTLSLMKDVSAEFHLHIKSL